MSNGISKIFAIALLWCIIICMQIFFPDSIGSPRNNGYIISACAAICFFIYPNVKIVLISICLFIIFLICSNDIIHPLGDIAKIFMCLCSLMIALKSRFSKYEENFLFYILSFFIIADVLGTGFSSLYVGGIINDSSRYSGILHGTNVNSTIFALAQIALFELTIRDSKRNKYLYVFLFTFVLIFMVSKTRSLLFFIPYWIVQSYLYLNKKLFYFIVILVIAYITKDISGIFQNIRLDNIKDDNSYITRMYLYENLLKGIKEYMLIFPHGSNSANLLSKLVTRDDDFSAHNDILLYIYDWGIIFLFLILYGIRQIRKKINVDWKYMLIVLCWSSSCLHNILLLPSSYLIFMIASNLYFRNLKEKRLNIKT